MLYKEGVRCLNIDVRYVTIFMTNQEKKNLLKKFLILGSVLFVMQLRACLSK